MSTFGISVPQQSRSTILLLPQSVLQLACSYLGPSCSWFRAVCIHTRVASNHLDLAEEILKWHCVNGMLLYLCPMLHHEGWLEHLGKLRLLCTLCEQVSRSKHIYRLNPRLQDPSWRYPCKSRKGKYVCGMCMFKQCREFLQGHENFLPWLFESVIKGQLTTELVRRVAMKGFLGSIIASNRRL
jgi:hypothetical protein